MVSHSLPPIRKRKEALVKTKHKNEVAYQIGVDILGFPIYMEHKIYQDRLPEHKHNEKKHWVSVIQKIIKQH